MSDSNKINIFYIKIMPSASLRYVAICFLLLPIRISYCCHNTTTDEFGLSDSIQDDDCPYFAKDFSPETPPWRFYSEGNCTRDENILETVHLVCTGGLDEHYARRSHYRVHMLTIQNWPLPCFPPDHVLRHFPAIRNLTIKNSSFRRFSSDFPPSLTRLRHIKLFNLPNITLEKSVFKNLILLHDLDMRGNALEHLKPEVLSSSPNLTTVYLLNNLWNCSHLDVKWLSRQNTTAAIVAKKRIVDFKNLTCQGKMFKGKPLHVVMDLFTSLREECPKECHCFLTNLVKTPHWNDLVPVSTVDCRWRGLTEFPQQVPAITTVVMLHGNKISDVRPLAQNPTYKKVADIYLDDNRVSTLRPLEGSDWIMSFRVLSVRGNNITHIPIYAFDNAFQHNLNVARIFLGNNPWRCDCHYTPRFQDLLLKHQNIMQGLSSIKCVKSDNEDISMKSIYSLSRSAVCRQAAEVLQPIDVLNVILSILILIVVVKFAYDYYNFKKTGKLPWLVDKLP